MNIRATSSKVRFPSIDPDQAVPSDPLAGSQRTVTRFASHWYLDLIAGRRGRDRVMSMKEHVPKQNVTLDSDHPIVGTWVEVENPILPTTVVYTISTREGHVCVTGADESDGVELEITNIAWDGTSLRFESLFPPTNHKAGHLFQMTGKARASHKTSYADDEGGRHTVNEVWEKRLSQ